MKILPLFLGLALATAPAMAQTAVTKVAPLPINATEPKMATVTPFIAGLKEPQGMALDTDKNLLVCDYGAGEILKFSPDGKPLGKFAAGLKGPSAIVSQNGYTYVSERKANRVVQFHRGVMTVLAPDIPEPIGLTASQIKDPAFKEQDGPLMAQYLTIVSHTTSKIYRVNVYRGKINTPELMYAAPTPVGEQARYGFRWLSESGGAFLMSDEVGERLLMLTYYGQVANFATGISDPSGVVLSPYPDRAVYVANEGDGGQLIRLNSEGEKTIVAEKLGRPRGILFLDAKTALVSNRDGNVWKVVLP